MALRATKSDEDARFLSPATARVSKRTLRTRERTEAVRGFTPFLLREGQL